MAISGFQIGLMASIGFWLGIMLAKPCCLLFNARPHWQHWPRRLLPSVCSIALATRCIPYLADFSLPAERAWVACLLVNGAWLLTTCVPCAIVVMVLVSSARACNHLLAPLNTGFWLSYCAVAALLYFSAVPQRISHTRFIEAQWIITLCTDSAAISIEYSLHHRFYRQYSHSPVDFHRYYTAGIYFINSEV